MLAVFTGPAVTELIFSIVTISLKDLPSPQFLLSLLFVPVLSATHYSKSSAANYCEPSSDMDIEDQDSANHFSDEPRNKVNLT